MAIKISDSLQISGNKPLDSRTRLIIAGDVPTAEELKTIQSPCLSLRIDCYKGSESESNYRGVYRVTSLGEATNAAGITKSIIGAVVAENPVTNSLLEEIANLKEELKTLKGDTSQEGGEENEKTIAAALSDFEERMETKTHASSTYQPIGTYATLDGSGKVPSSQLPSYVDDVLEYANLSSFPATGESGKIYVALDTNKTYRWSISTYVVISETLALGETSSTAYRGDRGKIAYDHSQSTHAPSDAQKNVQSDWNATSGDAMILNKPTIPTIPSSLPANGGNADTVDNKHASDFAEANHTHSQYLTEHQSLSGYYTKTEVDALLVTIRGEIANAGALL